MKPIEQMTLAELKCLAYDQMREASILQNNIQLLNAQIEQLDKKNESTTNTKTTDLPK